MRGRKPPADTATATCLGGVLGSGGGRHGDTQQGGQRGGEGGQGERLRLLLLGERREAEAIGVAGGNISRKYIGEELAQSRKAERQHSTQKPTEESDQIFS